jgi:hypothetical protein
MDVRLTPLSNYEVAMEWTVPSGPSRLESGKDDIDMKTKTDSL